VINYEGVERLLQGNIAAKKIDISPGSLVLFRGRDAIHRVTPVEGDSIRILSVLAYNSKPGVSLSESARMTFFGRLN
jgi:predicted 2-oxoglutarate/Fe(II)-dependent dioxygenase YbiX